VHEMKTYSGNRGIAPLIRKPDTTWRADASLLTYFNTDCSKIASEFVVMINVFNCVCVVVGVQRVTVKKRPLLL